MITEAALGLALVFCFSACVAATVGFGAMITTVIIASNFMPIPEILPRAVPVNLLLALYVVLKNRDHIQFGFLLRHIFPLMGAGMAVGIFLFASQGEEGLKFVFALVVVALSAAELWKLKNAREGDEPKTLSLPAKTAALLGAGVIHGMFASGGPLVVYVMGRVVRDKAQFRATLCALWVVSNLVLITAYLGTGKISAETGAGSLVLVPSLLVGIWAGEKIHHRLHGNAFRGAVFVILFLAAAVMAWTSQPFPQW